jgi:hypothetical protein
MADRADFVLEPEVFDPRPRHNPAGDGRPKGAGNVRYRALERAARAESLPIVMKLIDLAKSGDILAARLILDRIWPRPKSAPITVDLPATGTPDEIRAAMHELLQRIASGAIAPDDGQAIMGAMKDILTAYVIPAYGSSAIVVTEGKSAREQLAERLQKAIAARAETADAT